MASIQKSLRIPKNLYAELMRRAEETGKDFTSLANELLDEALRIQRCPGVTFAEGVTGRRARLAGTGIEVWEIIATYKGVGQNLNRLRTAYQWLSDVQLRSAIGYYRLYKGEIDHLIKQNENWTKDHLKKTYPPFSADDR